MIGQTFKKSHTHTPIIIIPLICSRVESNIWLAEL